MNVGVLEIVVIILIVIAILAIVGIAIFLVPWEGLSRDIACGDTSYKYVKHPNSERWYDPSMGETQSRRIVYIPNDAQGLKWKFIDESFTHPDHIDQGLYRVNAASAKDLRQFLEGEKDKYWFPGDAWHWFDCTICETQGECS